MWWLWIYSTFMLCVQWYVKTGIVLLFSVGMKRTIYQHFLQNTLHLYGLYYSLILNIVLIIIIALLEISSPLNFILSISLTSFAFSLSLYLYHSLSFLFILPILLILYVLIANWRLWNVIYLEENWNWLRNYIEISRFRIML